MFEAHSLQYGATRIDYRIARRDRKTLEIAVEPDASITVAAPIDAPIAAIETKLRKRAPWILRQQRYFAQFMPRTPPRQYVSGETHLYLGRQYRLKVVHDIQADVKLKRGQIVVRSHYPQRPDVTKDLFEAWRRSRAKLKFQERLETSVQRFPEPEAFRPQTLIVRKLRQRWGSMSPSRRLLLNTRLIEAPVDAIDYVITHELCHVAEPNHGPAFVQLLDRVLPDWEKRKLRLERALA